MDYKVKKQEQLKLVDYGEWWEEYWEDMPEYDNNNIGQPEVMVVIKFRNIEDFDEFHTLLKNHIFNGEKVFDGMQRQTRKTTWYPLNRKASKYVYIDES